MPRDKSKIQSFIKHRIKDFMLNFFFVRVYMKASRKPVGENKVVFIEAKELSMPDSFKVIYGHLQDEYDFDVSLILLKERHIRVSRYFKNCVFMLREVAAAKYVFLNDASNIISCLSLRPETKVIQLWHACGAFKKWGMSTADLKFGGSRNELIKHPFYKNLSLVTVSSPEVVWAYTEAMALEDQKEIIQPLGVSRTDVFFDDAFIAHARIHVERLIPECLKKKIILYAPTFRGKTSSAKAPNALDISLMRKALEEDYVLLIKHHPFVKRMPTIPADCKDFAFLTGSHIAIEDLLCVADVCITDYSSVIFEYSLFSRPMIFFAYDLEEYYDWRGFYYDYDELTPGPVYQSTHEIVECIEKLESFDSGQVVNFKNRFMSACDGGATGRICETVFASDLEIYKKRKIWDKLAENSPIEKDISIVIPAHDAMPELSKALQSIIHQSYDLDRIEAIVVDDGSRDDTWATIQDFVTRYPNIFKAHKLSSPSGSPAKPRNIALDIAQGAYIFFLDADDWLGSEAVEKMLEHATNWNSDVLLVKMVGEGDREVPQSMFTHNQPTANLYTSKILWSLGPLKLYRRSLLEEHKIRFFEKGMPEDLHLVLPALVEADRISVASDYDYYHVCWREGEDKNTSMSLWEDLESNLISYQVLFDFIKRRTPKINRDRVLMRRLFRRDVYHMFISVIENYQGKEREELYSRMVDLFSPYYGLMMFRTCPFDKRLLLDVGMSGNLPLLEHVVQNRESIVENCVFYGRGKKIFYRLETKDGSTSGEISKSLNFTGLVDDVEHDGTNIMQIKGVSTISKSIMLLSGEKRLDIVIRKKNSKTEISFCGEYQREEDSLLDVNECELSWQATVDFTSLNAVVGQTGTGSQWYVYLRLSGESFSKEIGVGSSSCFKAESSFLAFQASVNELIYEPSLTKQGNFSFIVRRG